MRFSLLKGRRLRCREHVLLLGGVQRIPGLVGDGDEDAVDQVVGQHQLLGHFIELGRTHRRQRVVLAVDGAGLQAQVDLAEGQGCGRGAQRFAQEQPFLGAGHAQLDALEVGWCAHIARFTQVHLAGAQVDGGEHRHVHLLGDGFEQLLPDRAVEHLLLVLRIAHHVAGGEDGELGHQLGDVKGRDGRELQVAARHGGRLGALLEQRGVQVDLRVELVGRGLVQRLLEHRPHLGMPVVGHGRCGNAQRDLGLCHGVRAQAGQGEQAGGGQQQFNAKIFFTTF